MLASSFGPSVQNYNQVIKNNVEFSNPPIDANRANLLKEDARAAVFAASIGIKDSFILDKYYQWCKQADGDADLSQYTAFRRSYLLSLERRTCNPANTVDTTTNDRGTENTTNIVDEMLVRSEYEKWLVRYDKKADENRYPQFRKNYIQQFENDVKLGQFYSLNEFGDCTEGKNVKREVMYESMNETNR